jgi:hypothetical protein
MNHVMGTFHGSQLALPAAQATLLTGTPAGRPNLPRLTVFVTNNSGAVLYLGNATATATTGFPVANGVTVTVDAADGLYGFSTAGGSVGLLEGF